MKIILLTMGCRLRYGDSGTHSHHCWQIDQYIGGEATVYLNDQQITVPGGACIIMPTYVEHRIVAPENSILNSVKFDPETTRFNRIKPGIVQGVEFLDVFLKIVDRNLKNREVKEHYLDILLLQLLEQYLPERQSATELDPRVRQALNYIEQNIFMPPSLDDLAKHVNMSKSNFVRVFREQTGTSAIKKLRLQKGHKAMEMLTHSDLSISQIGDALGFPSLQAFSRFFHNEFAIYPKEFRSKV
jgi:AraC-like DNA-binding protein